MKITREEFDAVADLIRANAETSEAAPNTQRNGLPCDVLQVTESGPFCLVVCFDPAGRPVGVVIGFPNPKGEGVDLVVGTNERDEIVPYGGRTPEVASQEFRGMQRRLGLK